MESTKINSDVTVGGQPSREQLEDIANRGFRSVINFRHEGEDNQPLSPAEEGEAVESLGLQYLHIPVSGDSLSPEIVDRFRRRYADLPKPVFAHCKAGTRAGAMVMMHVASEQGMSGRDALVQAEGMGFKCNQPELKKFVEQYVDDHNGRDM